MVDFNEIREAKKRNISTIMKKANVVGVAIGYKEKGGQKTDTPNLVVLVRKKLPSSELSKQDLVPPEVDKIGTDVKVVGEIRALNQSPKDRWRPAPGGVSIGHYAITAGTLGVVVKDNTTGEKLILSNNHVMANSNDAATGDAILQPGPYDGGRLPDDTIAHLLRFVPIRYTTESADCPISTSVANIANFFARALGSSHRLVATRQDTEANLVDAAIASPIDSDIIGDDILSIGQIIGTKEAELGMAVRKSGRTTGFTTGTIELLDATISVSYGTGRTAVFEGQIITGAMSQGGDSGSLLVDGNENLAVGLLFAGSDETTIHNPISAVINALDISLS